MNPMKHSRIVALTVLCLFAGPASAHTGNHLVTGFTSGLTHPLSGLDHLLAMIAIGLWAQQQGGRCGRYRRPALLGRRAMQLAGIGIAATGAALLVLA